MNRLLAALGVLFLLAASGIGAFAFSLPAGRIEAAVLALKGQTAPAPAPPVAPEPMDAGLILDARSRLQEAKEELRQEQVMVQAQLKAERGELESLKSAVEAKEAALKSRAAAAQALPAPPAADEKGAKAVAEIAARMPPKDAVKMLADESEAGVAQILRRMDAKMAGKVMAEMVNADPDRAKKVVSLMKEGPKAK